MHYGICENGVLHVLLFYRCLGFGPHDQSTRPFRFLSCGPCKQVLSWVSANYAKFKSRACTVQTYMHFVNEDQKQKKIGAHCRRRITTASNNSYLAH